MASHALHILLCSNDRHHELVNEREVNMASLCRERIGVLLLVVIEPLCGSTPVTMALKELGD